MNKDYYCSKECEYNKYVLQSKERMVYAGIFAMLAPLAIGAGLVLGLAYIGRTEAKERPAPKHKQITIDTVVQPKIPCGDENDKFSPKY